MTAYDREMNNEAFDRPPSTGPRASRSTAGVEEGSRLQRWEQTIEPLFIALSVCFLAAYALPILYPTVTGDILRLCRFTQDAIWTVFAIDYLVRLALARDRGRWFLHHLFSLATVVLPMFRSLRLLRLLTLLDVLNRQAGLALRGRITAYAVSSVMMIIVTASLAVLDAERAAPDSAIDSIEEALWWACVTITTVGYGDMAPVTATGRWIAAALMVCGIALLGTVTAMIASWLVEKVADADEASQAATRADIHRLRQEVDELHRLMAQREAGPTATEQTPGTPDRSFRREDDAEYPDPRD